MVFGSAAFFCATFLVQISSEGAVAMRFKLLHLYLFRRFLNNLLFCTAAILVIYIVVDYVGKIKKFSGVPLSTKALYYLVSMPSIINLVFSIIMLLTAMFTIGN